MLPLNKENPAKCVLLVEDYPPNVLVATTLLEGFNFQYDVVSSGEEAIAKTADNDYALILMDVKMSGIDGFETTRLIREREQSDGRRTPIVAMTAHALAGDRQKCIDNGMDDYISKPFDPDELLNLLQRYAGN